MVSQEDLGPPSLVTRAAFAVVTATLLLLEITLTRVFSGTIGYYFAFMSISVAMLGLGAGSLWVTLRGAVSRSPLLRAASAATALGATGAFATAIYLRYYPAMGEEGLFGQAAYVGLFAALFLPFLAGGVLLAVIFEAHRASFNKLYAIDLIGAAVGCVLAVFLLDRVPAPKAMFFISALGAGAAPLFFLAAGQRSAARNAALGLAGACVIGVIGLRGTDLFACRVIRNQPLPKLEDDRWNDFSRVIVRPGNFYTWGLSNTYKTPHPAQLDLLIEGVAGTQIQEFHDRDFSRMDFFGYDVASLPHRLRPTGSTLVLGVGAGFDVMMAKYFHKDPVVGVEVNPLVGEIVNRDFGDYSGRPYELPGVTIHYENARTFVKRDTAKYDLVTVTWVDSGAATGAGAFALTENYLYTVEGFKDYIARLNEDGVLAFMRARSSPEYDAIKGIGVAVEAMRQLGIPHPEQNIVVTSVRSEHFGWREMTHVMIKKKPFTPDELSLIDREQKRLWFGSLYAPGRTDDDPTIERMITGTDRQAV